MSLEHMLANGWDGAVGEDGLQMLSKALEAGSGVDAASFAGGRALIPESLDTTLVSVLWSQDEAKLFKALKRNPIKGPVHQWNKRTDVGDEDGAWVAEGGSSFEKDQTIQRKFVETKYLQTKRQVTLQMMASNSLEDAEAIEKEAGALWIVRQTERALFDGDSDIVAEQFDGLTKGITSNIVDLRGSDLITSSAGEDAFIEGCKKIRDAYGKANTSFMNTSLMEDTQKLLRDRLRVPASGGGSNMGAYVYDTYPTPFGSFKLNDNIFVRQHDEAQRASTITAQRPDQVSIAVARAASGALESQWATGDAGDYYYQVVAVNKYGDAVASTAVQVTSVVADDKVTITVTDGATVGTGFKVYRSEKDAADGSNCRFVTQVARTGASQEIIDLNADLPNTSRLYLLTTDNMYNAIEWEQWLPTMKFQLYPTNAAVNPFLMLMFGALGLKKEEQMCIIKNVSYSKDKWY